MLMITTIFFVSSDLRILPRTPHHGMLVICDVPDSRIALLRRGFKVLASSDFTCNSFWNDVINSRNKLLKKIPISDILRSSDLSSELDGSHKIPS